MVLGGILRKPRHIAWLESLVAPMVGIYNKFLSEQSRLNVEVNANSQTMLLEWLLNNRFDSTQRRIFITNNQAASPLINAYLKKENQPRLNAYRKGEGPKVVIGTKTETNITDFYVNIPAALSGQQVPLSRLTSKYKLAGKTFVIIIN